MFCVNFTYFPRQVVLSLKPFISYHAIWKVFLKLIIHIHCINLNILLLCSTTHYHNTPVSSLSSIRPKATIGSTICTTSGVSSVLLRTSLNASLSSSMKSSDMLTETSALVSPTPNVTLMTPES